MEDILKITSGYLVIKRLVIDHFTKSSNDMAIIIETRSDELGSNILKFEHVSALFFDHKCYPRTENATIEIFDISDKQTGETTYSVDISEGMLRFYCRNVALLGTTAISGRQAIA